MFGSDSYIGIENVSEGLYKDRGSRFISYAYPVVSEDEVKELVDALKREHHAARHHCFAYRIGMDGKVFRASDDGEPSGTAGRQILGAIDSAGLSDVLVVVVRYFGGILLGVPGLIKAYKEAAADALANAQRVEKIPVQRYELEFGYEQMNDVQKLLKSFGGAKTVSQDFDLLCRMQVDIRMSDVESFTKKIEENNYGRGTHIQCRALQVAAAGNRCFN